MRSLIVFCDNIFVIKTTLKLLNERYNIIFDNINIICKFYNGHEICDFNIINNPTHEELDRLFSTLKYKYDKNVFVIDFNKTAHLIPLCKTFKFNLISMNNKDISDFINDEYSESSIVIQPSYVLNLIKESLIGINDIKSEDFQEKQNRMFFGLDKSKYIKHLNLYADQVKEFLDNDELSKVIERFNVHNIQLVESNTEVFYVKMDKDILKITENPDSYADRFINRFSFIKNSEDDYFDSNENREVSFNRAGFEVEIKTYCPTNGMCFGYGKNSVESLYLKDKLSYKENYTDFTFRDINPAIFGVYVPNEFMKKSVENLKSNLWNFDKFKIINEHIFEGLYFNGINIFSDYGSWINGFVIDSKQIKDHYNCDGYNFYLADMISSSIKFSLDNKGVFTIDNKKFNKFLYEEKFKNNDSYIKHISSFLSIDFDDYNFNMYKGEEPKYKYSTKKFIIN